ncbi:hypothetical protein GCM10008018_66170 [Paenibacillus marchantiophytorum]|uniref:Uncharacterized protein n=1 Tax=Paenibacillus marchantiophytorum TaxID=1619310 RepID=A0ABQ1FHB8_9BACL|nr:hypothetical protein [Paenibacillus marchantiophytorum]GGA11882.1 hypothetical protein GCM10008018_66170 [Paenibacillus marchantiophytorum]
MNNLQRLQLEIQGIELTHEEIQLYLTENGLKHYEEYNPESNKSKRSIYQTALAILESVANNPTLMKDYKQDDMTISAFYENLMSRIDQLERKVRQMSSTDDKTDSNFFMLFQ